MERLEERRVILKRFFWSDRQLYQLGKLAGIEWFDIFERKFTRDEYAYFASEEKKEAIEKIVTLQDDGKFIEILNHPSVQPKFIEIDRFVGEHYFFDRNTGFKYADERESLRKDVRNALQETKPRGYFFLKAIIDLEAKGKWDRAYGGATWVDILSEIRQLEGKYPSQETLRYSDHIEFTIKQEVEDTPLTQFLKK